MAGTPEKLTRMRSELDPVDPWRDTLADAITEIAELQLGVELLAKCAMAAHEALKCRDRFGWSPEADAALELLRATVPPMPFVPGEQPHVLAARIKELTLYAAGVEAEREALRAQVEALTKDAARLDWFADHVISVDDDCRKSKTWRVDAAEGHFFGDTIREALDAAIDAAMSASGGEGLCKVRRRAYLRAADGAGN